MCKPETINKSKRDGSLMNTILLLHFNFRLPSYEEYGPFIDVTIQYLNYALKTLERLRMDI